MDYKRILTLQDISCLGQCSLTVALPILSACGHETCIIPSAVLSTHTNGFTGYTFRDLTDDIPAIAAHWKKEGISFDAVYTGYLGSVRQTEMVRDIFAALCRPGAFKAVDPAMADNGKLYPGFSDDFIGAMTALCASADIVLPNITEACMMTGTEYRTEYDMAYIESLLGALSRAGMNTVILTGVSFEPSTTGVIVAENGKTEYYRHRRLPQGCHGTGDVFASAFCGALLRGKSKYDSAAIAADFTLKCIENTVGDESHRYGVKFETAIPDLIAALGK